MLQHTRAGPDLADSVAMRPLHLRYDLAALLHVTLHQYPNVHPYGITSRLGTFTDPQVQECESHAHVHWLHVTLHQ